MKNLLPCDGIAQYIPGFFSLDESHYYFENLFIQLDWQPIEIKIFGKKVHAPRLVAWYGDEGVAYQYSGHQHLASGWHPLLNQVRKRLEKSLDFSFNSVLCNLYRNGQDAMGWHCDNEPELGLNPVIVSVSFGATRKFKFKHRRTKEVVDILLESGSILIMQGEVQHYWLHALPRTKKCNGPRINLTFRQILG